MMFGLLLVPDNYWMTLAIFFGFKTFTPPTIPTPRLASMVGEGRGVRGLLRGVFVEHLLKFHLPLENGQHVLLRRRIVDAIDEFIRAIVWSRPLARLCRAGIVCG